MDAPSPDSVQGQQCLILANNEAQKFMRKCFKWEVMYMYEDPAMRKLKNMPQKVPSVKDVAALGPDSPE
jgi:hypothetical protein